MAPLRISTRPTPHHGPRTPVALVLLCLLTAAAPGCRESAEIPELPLPSDHPPYVFAAPTRQIPGGRTLGHTGLPNLRVLDIDGDGDQDLLYASDDRLRLKTNRDDRMTTAEAMPVDPGYGYDGCLAIHAPLDLDGDGLPEIPFSGPAADRSHWRVWVLDPRAWQVVRSFDLPAGPDRHADGHWDGSFAVQGLLDVPTDDGVRPAFLISVTAGYDAWPRGVRAVDAETGEVLWRFESGAKPSHISVVLADLDGDGWVEVVYGTSGTGNIAAADAGGLGDDHAVVFCLAADGTLRWSRILGPHPSGAMPRVVDLDHDGLLDLLVVHGSERNLDSRIEVWDAGDGSPLASYHPGPRIRRFALLPTATATDIVLNTVANDLVRLAYRDGGLHARRHVRGDRELDVIACLDAIGLGEPQVLVREPDGDHWLLPGDLSRPLAVLPRDVQGQALSQVVTLDLSGRCHLLLLGREELQRGVVVVEPGEQPRDGLVAAGGAAAVLLFGGLALGYRRRRTRRGGPPAGLQPQRDLELRLLDDLAAESHGTIGALKIAASLIRLVRLRARDHLADLDRLARRVRDFEHTCWPRLAEILDRCAAAGAPAALVATARAEFAAFRDASARLAAAGFTPEAVAAEQPVLESAWQRGEAAFQTLRHGLEDDFHTDLADALAHVMELRADDLAGVSVDLDTAAAPRLRLHGDDLEFVLDNLVGNAVAAMAGRPERTLTVTAGRDGEVGWCEIADTGGGMPPELVARLGRERVTSKRDGGLGWLHSHTLLERYGGSLQVVASAPDGGTRVRLAAPRARTDHPSGEPHDR